jgi:hypothetical protein
MAERPEVLAAVNRAIAADAQIRARVKDFLTRTWLGLGSYRDADIDRFVNRVLPVVLGSQRQVASLTDAYLAQVSAMTVGGSAAPLGIRPAEVTGTALRGVEPRETYRRPAVELYTSLSNGNPFDQAVKDGLRRLISIGMTDLQLAKTHTARKVFESSNAVVGHRRTLTGSENCGLCRVAATQRYRKENLQPIHPGCDCGVAPIYGESDPGQVIDEQGLTDIHDAVAERFGDSASDARAIDYRKLILVENHGEIGPILTVKGQHFDGPSQIN